MITVIIIDDELHFAKILRDEIEIIARHKNMELDITITDDPVGCLKNVHIYDIYFIDIVMPEYMGLELARELREKHINSEFVFVTSYLQYMRKAFYVMPRAYIHKEYLKKELEDAFTVLEKIFRYRKTEISIKDNNRDVTVRPRDILYLKSDAHYVEIHGAEEGSIVIRNSLKNLEPQLKEFDFLRIHQRYLVNRNFIEEYRKHSVKLRNGEELQISAPYAKGVMDAEIERRLAGR